MDGQKLEGQLSQSYCAPESPQSDHHGERYLSNRPAQWLQWLVAVLCIHALVLAVLWGAVWHNVSDQDTMLTVELVSSGEQTSEAQRKGEAPPALAERTRTDQSEQTTAVASAENLETTIKPELAMERVPAKDTPRPVPPKPVMQKPAPAAARPPQAPSAKPPPVSSAASLQAGQSDPQQTSGASASASAASSVLDTDRSPSILSSPKPPYPRDAFRAKQEGRVSVDIEVLSDGKVGRTLLHATSGVTALDESALESIKKWQYSPGSRGGKLNAQWIRVVVSFELKNR
jgi:protein TonB